MIGLFAIFWLCAALGWIGRGAWDDRPIRFEFPPERLLSPYEIALADFDRRIKFARDHHMSVKHILDEKTSFVKAELEDEAHWCAASANTYGTIRPGASRFVGYEGPLG